MSWFKRLKDGISTATKSKKDVPEGIWYQCKNCKETSTTRELEANYYLCPKCDYHSTIGSEEYFQIIFDDEPSRHFDNLFAVDLLKFTDSKPYAKRLVDTVEKTGLNDAMAVAMGTCGGKKLVIAAMDFKFIGGSMGSVVGEKIARAIDLCIKERAGLLIISKSGGARMMESAFSLMQMAKTSAKLTQLSRTKLPYISLLTDPTTGGVTASYSMLGDVNIGEPGALIGFAGPRVIKETIKRDLPDGFQTAEFVLDCGFLDLVVSRKHLRETLIDLLEMFNFS
jgi:acetyl-CoA carboxylase carboxyl transferase subunit beta